MSKPSIPQGTRDFGPETVRKRDFIFRTIRHVFECYGFQPLETPAFENLETLMGKYGEEGDRLLFKILNNGLDHADKSAQAREEFEKVLNGRSTKGITERALKYDLTIPFARYVAMNHAQLSFPFRRYQIQPVWRADRPQKGRYREFTQCDADIVGSNSLWNETELIGLYHDVFSRLGLNDCTIRINHRHLLTALAEICGGTERLATITIVIDKLDKIGIDKVMGELTARGLNAVQLETVRNYLSIQGEPGMVLTDLQKLLGDTGPARTGIDELRRVLQQLDGRQIPVCIDPTLARGLDYYTGIILEAKAPPSVQIGSLGGGGRYDDLTGLFGVPGIPGVGISFGVDRIYDVMEELRLFPATVHIGTQVLFFHLGEAESRQSFALMQALREKGVRCELFHEQSKFDKQFKYAERRNIPYVVIIGEEELRNGTCAIKKLATGEQETLPVSYLEQYPFV